MKSLYREGTQTSIDKLITLIKTTDALDLLAYRELIAAFAGIDAAEKTHEYQELYKLGDALLKELEEMYLSPDKEGYQEAKRLMDLIHEVMEKWKRSDLEYQFHNDMIRIYKDSKEELGYIASRFLQMVDQHGGYEAARILIGSDRVSDGFITLWENNRIDLTVESVVLQDKYLSLFSEDELEKCRKRLAQYKKG